MHCWRAPPMSPPCLAGGCQRHTADMHLPDDLLQLADGRQRPLQQRGG